MSVIENAIKKLQAARNAAAAQRAGEQNAPPSAGAAARRQPVPETDRAAPSRTINVNAEALRAAGLLPPPHQERELAQQFRQIKRPLINNTLGRGVPPVPQGNLIVISSAVAGEGKTFTSLNLALSVRFEEDVTVLLVDGDVVNPRISQVLGAQAEAGLLDIIRDPTMPLASAILSTDVPGLAFLPAGRLDVNATELLASARMSQLMGQLAQSDPARLVLFDSAPLLLTTETQALVHHAGQIVVVVQAEHTPQHVVLEALRTLAEGKAVSLVLNQNVRQPHVGYYFQYGSSTPPPETAGGA